MSQMRNADAVFDRGVEYAGPLGGANEGPVYVNVDILQHLDTSLSQTTLIASNLHSLRQIPHF